MPIRSLSSAPSLLILALAGLVLVPPAVAQASYVYTLGDTSFDEGTDVGVDASGNAYFTGSFNGALDFDPGAGTATLTSSREDVYVASYDSVGALRFAFSLGSAFATSEAAGGIAVTDGGDFVVTGSQPFGSIDFDPGPTGSELRTGELFVAGYDASGDFRFAVSPTAQSNASSGAGTDVALDGDGNAYVTGRFVDGLDFNPLDASAPAVLTTVGSTDAFVASYTDAGLLRWAFHLGGTGADEGLGIVADAGGRVYVTGQFRDTVAFDPNDTNGDGDLEERTAGAGGSAFFAAYEADGAFRFAYAIGDDAVGEGLAITADGVSIYFAGTFTGTAAFDPENADGDGDPGELTSHPNGSAFLVRYTVNGIYRPVAVPLGGPSAGHAVTLDATGHPFLTGHFSQTLDLDPGVGDRTIDNDDGTDIFVASYDAGGAFRGAFAVGGNGLATGLGIAVGDDDRILLTGAFTNTADVDPGPSADERTSAGQNDLLMAQYPPLADVGIPFDPLADLALSLTADGTERAVGGEVVFVALLENEGPDATTDVEVAVPEPPGLSFDSVTPSAGTYDAAAGVWALPSLARGLTERETLTISATVTAVGTHTLAAAVTASGAADPDSTDNADSVMVTGVPDVPFACTADAPLSFSDYDADPDNGIGDSPIGEFARLFNGSVVLAVDLDGCQFIVIDPFTEAVTYAASTTGMVPADDSYSVANAPPSPGQTIPPETLPDGPGAFALVHGTIDAGDSIEDVLAAEIVAAVVYLDDATVYGEVGGGAAPANQTAFLDALARLRAVSADAGPEADLAVVTAPNPVAASGTVSFGIAEAGEVTVALYDALGREVAVLASGPHGAGRHTVPLPAASLSPGAYVVQVTAGSEVRAARLTVIR